MDRLICLMGPSGSGKTTIAKVLHKAFGMNIIQSYTTRKPRNQNEFGHTFIDMENYLKMKSEGAEKEMISFTVYGEDIYFALKEQFYGKGDSIYIIDPVGFKNIRKDFFMDTRIITIFVYLDKKEREERLIEEYRHNIMTRNNASLYGEIIERLDRDKEKYNFIEAPDYFIYNEQSDKTAQLIYEVLRSQ